MLEPRRPQYRGPRIVLDAVEGFGKTTCLAFAPNPVIVMIRGETGYDTLLGANLVPSVPAVFIESWVDLLSFLDSMIANSQGCATLGLDALSGAERLCHEHVCARDFGGDWGEKGFASYQKGYDRSVTDWLGMLQRLDQLHQAGMTIVLAGHVKISTFKNPGGADYDRYCCDIHHKTWSATHKWADAVLFGMFKPIIVDEKTTKHAHTGKAIGGDDRVFYTERHDTYDAKNRYNMPVEIELKGGPAKSWNGLAAHLPQKPEVK